MKYIKHIILSCLLLGNSYGQTVWLGTLDGNYTYTDNGAGTVWIGFGGGVSPALWTDTNSPAVLNYLQETQPSNFIADASVNGYYTQAAGTHPALFWCGSECGYYFDDNLSYTLETNSPNYLGASSNISVVAWLRSTDATANDGIMGVGSFANSQGECFLVTSSQNLDWRVNGSITEGAGRLTVANALPTDQWRHIVATYNGLGLCIYTNGVLAATNSYSAELDFTGLKTTWGGGYSSSFTFGGYIVQPRIYRRTITDAEIATMYNNGRTNAIADVIDTTDLAVFHPMTNDVLEAHDYAGNGVHLDPMPSFVNAPTFGGTNDMPAGLTYVEFDGTDDYLFGLSGDVLASVDTITNPRTNDFTLCAWFYINSHNATYGIAGRKPVADSNDGFGLWSCSAVTNHLKAQVGDGVSNVMIRSDEQITTNQWHFGAMRRDDFGTFEMYYDGAWQSQTNVANLDINIPDTSEWAVGSDANGGFPMNGRMLEVRYYPKALTDGEIDNIYQNTGTNNNEARFTLP